ncbi:MAG: hypothetical protein PVH45_05450, partial [Candidatus Omnitrophota bacterium]
LIGESLDGYITLQGKEFIIIHTAAGDLQIKEILPQDVNRDGVLDERDKDAVMAAVGAGQGEPAYSAGADLNSDGKVDRDDLLLYNALAPEVGLMQLVDIDGTDHLVELNADGRFTVRSADLANTYVSDEEGNVTINALPYHLIIIGGVISVKESLRADTDRNNILSAADKGLFDYAMGSGYIEPLEPDAKGSSVSGYTEEKVFDIPANTSGLYNVGIRIPKLPNLEQYKQNNVVEPCAFKASRIGSGGEETLLGFFDILPSENIATEGKINLPDGTFTPGEQVTIKFEWVNSAQIGYSLIVSEIFVEDAKFIPSADINGDNVVNAVDERIFKTERAVEVSDTIELYDPTIAEPGAADKITYSITTSVINQGQADEYTQYTFTSAAETGVSDENGRVVLGPGAYEFAVAEVSGNVVLKKISRDYEAASDVMTLAGGKVYIYNGTSDEFTELGTSNVTQVANGIVTLGDPAVEYNVTDVDGRIFLYEVQDTGAKTVDNIIRTQESGFEDADALSDGQVVTRGSTDYLVTKTSDGETILTLNIEENAAGADRYLFVDGNIYLAEEPTAGNYSITAVTGSETVVVDNAVGRVEIGADEYAIEELDGTRVKLVKIGDAARSIAERFIKVDNTLYRITTFLGGEYRFTNVDDALDYYVSAGGEVEIAGVIYSAEEGLEGELVLRPEFNSGAEDTDARIVKLGDFTYEVAGGPGSYVFTAIQAAAPVVTVDNVENTATVGGVTYNIAAAQGANDLLLIEDAPAYASLSTRLIRIDDEYYSIQEPSVGEFNISAYSSGADDSQFSGSTLYEGDTISIGERAFELVVEEDNLRFAEIPDDVQEDTAKYVALEGGIYQADLSAGDFSLVFVTGTDLAPVIDNVADKVSLSSGTEYTIWEDTYYGSIDLQPYVTASAPAAGEAIAVSYGAGHTAIYNAQVSAGEVTSFTPVMTTAGGSVPALTVNAASQTAALGTTIYDITVDDITGNVTLAIKPLRSDTIFNQRIELDGLNYDVIKTPYGTYTEVGYLFISEGGVEYQGTETEVTIDSKVYDIFID